MVESGEFITLARVVKTQGRHGEIAAEVHSAVPDRFTEGMRLSALGANDTRKNLEIEGFWPHKGLVVLKFRGIDSISDAEALIGTELQIRRAERATLERGWNYVSDLIGCVVFDHGREIGRIEDVQFGTGEAPLLVLAAASGKKFDVPFAEGYLEKIDIAEKQLRMQLPDGMLEINAPLTADEKQQQRERERERSGARPNPRPAPRSRQ